MFDWNWLWVVGEVGVTYGFYYWWKSYDKSIAVLEVDMKYFLFRSMKTFLFFIIQVAPDIDINDLKKFSSRGLVDYGVVHGIIRPNDSKSNSVLTSQYIPHCLGVIQRIILREKKLERTTTSKIW